MMPPAATRVYLACGFTDMRKGFDGLAAHVQTVLSLDPYGGARFVLRGRRGKHATFCIQFTSVDDRLSLASVGGADAAGLSTSSRQGADVHLYGRAPWSEPRTSELDVRSSLLRGYDAWHVPDQPGGFD